jgi:hypothetical protein
MRTAKTIWRLTVLAGMATAAAFIYNRLNPNGIPFGFHGF